LIHYNICIINLCDILHMFIFEAILAFFGFRTMHNFQTLDKKKSDVR
jgi:hypothetical protein